jgi:hypothetical protein
MSKILRIGGILIIALMVFSAVAMAITTMMGGG